MQRVELRGGAMGSDLHIIVWAPSHADRLAALAVRRIELLEQCWSRFRPDSELNRLNSLAGNGPVAVSDDLGRLVGALIAACEWSDGDVDASVLAGMVAMGYDRDFASVIATPLPPTWDCHAGAGMAGVRLHDGTVSIPRGVGLDPGAIGKGLAGDIVTAEIADAGAVAVLVGIGGDVVTSGTPPDSGTWHVSVRDDRTTARTEIDVLPLSETSAAVATSSILRRRWSGRHHVLDPRSGRPVHSDIVQATVVARTGWLAEAGATVAIARGAACLDWLSERGCTAYLLEGTDVHA
jgi:thiamine biosynthesis lipoprotein